MNHPVKVQGRQYVGMARSVAFGEGFLAGAAGEIMQAYLAYPLVMLLLALYTACRAGYVHRGAFLLGALSGFFVPSLSLKAAGAVLVPLSVIAAYYLFSGAHFFATYSRTRRAWLVTACWASVSAFFVAYLLPHLLAVMLTPLVWLCFLPLWSASLRVLHYLLFALVYLAVLHHTGMQIYSSWSLWVAVGGMSFIPELLARLYPERKHKLDSLPVLTPTLNFGQKLWSAKEVLFLVIDFYALSLEKYKWLDKIAPFGKYMALIGVGLELSPLFTNQVWLPAVFPLALVVAGLLISLEVADFAAAGFSLGLYALALGAGRGFLASGFQPKVVGWAVILFLLGAVIFFGRPKERKEDRQRWKELNKL